MPSAKWTNVGGQMPLAKYHSLNVIFQMLSAKCNLPNVVGQMSFCQMPVKQGPVYQNACRTNGFWPKDTEPYCSHSRTGLQ